MRCLGLRGSIDELPGGKEVTWRNWKINNPTVLFESLLNSTFLNGRCLVTWSSDESPCFLCLFYDIRETTGSYGSFVPFIPFVLPSLLKLFTVQLEGTLLIFLFDAIRVVTSRHSSKKKKKGKEKINPDYWIYTLLYTLYTAFKVKVSWMVMIFVSRWDQIK